MLNLILILLGSFLLAWTINKFDPIIITLSKMKYHPKTWWWLNIFIITPLLTAISCFKCAALWTTFTVGLYYNSPYWLWLGLFNSLLAFVYKKYLSAWEAPF